MVLCLCFATTSQADDIRDFQIEGISVGDSLLDYFPKKLKKQKDMTIQIQTTKVINFSID